MTYATPATSSAMEQDPDAAPLAPAAVVVGVGQLDVLVRRPQLGPQPVHLAIGDLRVGQVVVEGDATPGRHEGRVHAVTGRDAIVRVVPVDHEEVDATAVKDR